MNRILATVLLLMTTASMTVSAAMAEDMLNLGGQMRVRGWYADDGGSSTTTWADQRLRIGGQFSIADGVSITFRTDVTESDWGSGNTYGSGRLDVQQWDRAHLDLNFRTFSFRAGQQLITMGTTKSFDAQTNGIKFTTTGAVAVTVFGLLQDSNIEEVPPGSGNYHDNTDSFYYGTNIGFGSDRYRSNFYIVGQNKVKNSDEDLYLIGADLTYNLVAVRITGEVDFFTGDASDTADAMGLQGFVDVSMDANEALTLGGQLYYAQGDKKDTQYSSLGNNFDGWDPLFEHGTELNNEAITPDAFGYSRRPFEFFGHNSGVLAGRIYVDTKVGDSLSLGTSFTYLEPEEDANITADSAVTVAAGLKYAVLTNTTLGVLAEYIDVDDKGVDEIFAGGLGVFVNF